MAFHSPEAMQHNFVPEFHTRFMELKPYSPCMNEMSIKPHLTQTGLRTQGIAQILGSQSKKVRLIVKQLQMKAGW